MGLEVIENIKGAVRAIVPAIPSLMQEGWQEKNRWRLPAPLVVQRWLPVGGFLFWVDGLLVEN